MKSIAIIPARSGSKGLKDKNIRIMNGKPLIAYSIMSAIGSNCFDVVHVSTDSNLYADLSKKYGADVPFLRSADNSSDSSSTWSVIKEVLLKYRELGTEFDYFMVLQPTSPFRTKNDIINAFKQMDSNNADAIVSVCEVDHSPMLMNKLPDNNSMKGFFTSNVDKSRRQDFGKYYRINGAIYLMKTQTFFNDISIYDSNCFAYIMDKSHSIDIDDEFDFFVAEQISKGFFNK